MTKNILTAAQADFRQFAVYPQVSTPPTNALTTTRYGTITTSRDRNTAPGAVVIKQVMDREQIITQLVWDTKLHSEYNIRWSKLSKCLVTLIAQNQTVELEM